MVKEYPMGELGSLLKVGIIGSRTRNTSVDYEKVRQKFDMWYLEYISNHQDYKYGDIWIVSGGQKLGADGWAEGIAKDYELVMLTFHAPWRVHERAAGPIRNHFIAYWSDDLMACYDGKSAGTGDCIKKFKEYHSEGQLILV